MAKTATKTVKKVSTAKGKGKAPKAKVVTKKAAPVAKKKPAVKTPTVRKARVPKEVDPNKYGKFIILDAFNEKYPEMVIIDKAPAAYSKLVGKKYVSRSRFITFIEGEKAYVSIDKGAKAVKEELIEAGLAGIDSETI
jgi:hypothetical protein